MSAHGARIGRRRFLRHATVVASGAPVLGQATLASAQQAPVATTAPSPTSADVGTLFPFIRAQARTGPFPMSFLQPRHTDVASWTRESRRLVLDLLHYAPPPVDPRPEVLERVDMGDYVRERVVFSTTPDVRVPAYVLVPRGASAARPAPAVVALHDHGGFYLWGKEKLVAIDGEHPVLGQFRERSYGGRSIAIELVRRGYVVVVTDMFYWGDRRMLLDDDAADWRTRPVSMPMERVDAFNARASQNEQLVGRTLYSAGLTWPGIMAWDDIRTVDYLRSRADVDATRIGCVGLSVGAVRSMYLAALDERIKAAVVVCWMTSFPKQLQKHVRHTIGHTKVIPGVHRHLDYPDIGAIAMPRPVLYMSGTRDGLFDLDGTKSAFDTLQQSYAKAGAPDHCRTRLYDSPHQFNAEMQAEAWAWLGKYV